MDNSKRKDDIPVGNNIELAELSETVGQLYPVYDWDKASQPMRDYSESYAKSWLFQNKGATEEQARERGRLAALNALLLPVLRPAFYTALKNIRERDAKLDQREAEIRAKIKAGKKVIIPPELAERFVKSDASGETTS